MKRQINDKKEVNWERYKEHILPKLKTAFKVKEFKWHCQITKGEYNVDYYPKKDRVCVRIEFEKGHKWHDSGLSWLLSYLIEIK